jgi:Fe-S cluster assembly iron-binding protein IscA
MADQGAPITDTNGNYYSYMDGDVFIANGDGEFLVQLHNSDVPALNDYTIDYAVDLFGDQSPNII